MYKVTVKNQTIHNNVAFNNFYTVRNTNLNLNKLYKRVNEL